MPAAFSWEVRPDRVVVLTIDLAGKKVNTLGREVLRDLSAALDAVESTPDLRGLLFRSGKAGQFVAGADLHELAGLAGADKARVEAALIAGQGLFARVAALPFPTVALIDGPCIGGGTELALAMDARIVTKAATIALPETKLGLLPGWGGTQRLPRLIGVPPAIEMIVTGEAVDAKRAVAIGLAFDVVPADRLVDEGVGRIDHLRDEATWKADRASRSGPVVLSEDESGFAFAVAEAGIRARAKGDYPAPLIALKAIQEGSRLILEAGLAVERRAALELVGSQTCANLIGVFLIQNKLGREGGVGGREVSRVGVIGAGLMGAGIAAAAARSGLATTMVDLDEARLDAGLARASEVVASRITIGRATGDDLARMLARLNSTTTTRALGDADLVVEAIVEDEATKTDLYHRLAADLRDDAILASNTSTISISRMARSAPSPERFVGLHFFSPVDRMTLVEVVRGEATSDATVATVVALARRLRKVPIVVGDGPGFLVNRVLFPYMNESLLLMEEGVPIDRIDAVATRFGMPLGPIALHDAVGLDVALAAGRVMGAAFADRAVVPGVLGRVVAAGRLGKKAGAGFRRHSAKGKAEADPAVDALIGRGEAGPEASPESIADRLFLPMLLEATRVIEDGVARDPGELDVALILGIGFPPFRGGLLRWADSVGASEVLRRLEPYRSLGRRFEPTETLTRLASTGGSFYGRSR